MVKQLPNGVRVIGRDFGFSLSGTASSITNWELIGGMPITPAVLASSALRAYTQSYANFKVNGLIVHYITSSPTSQAGDVLFYYERARANPGPDFSNSNFLPFVLSDPKTVIGPQWTNHSAVITPAQDWKSTAYGIQQDIDEDCAGAIYMFSKTNSANSPGYIIFDYDISFTELSVNPRAGVLPVSRGQFYQTALGITGVAVTAGTTAYSQWVVQGLAINGSAAQNPTGLAAGDVYKCVVSATASNILNAPVNCTLANILRYAADTNTGVTIDDGFTFYVYYLGSTGQFRACSTFLTAESRTDTFVAGVTATVTFSLCVNMHLVGSVGSSIQNAY